jgi:hypothetical protein
MTLVTGQRDYLYRADQSDAPGTSIPLAELPATVTGPRLLVHQL